MSRKTWASMRAWAIFCRVAGSPPAPRSRASAARSSTARSNRAACARPPRSKPKTVIAIFQPSPGRPTRSRSSTSAPDRKIAELAPARHLFDATDLHSRLVHVDEEEPDAAVWVGARVGAGEQEALVGVVGPARTRLLAAEHPPAIALFRAGAQARQVAARVWLAEALAEDQLAAEDLLHVRVLLPLASEAGERGRQQGHSEAAQDARRARTRHLLLVDGLHYRRGAAAADLRRPAELQPAALVQLALPVALEVGVLLVAVTAFAVLPPRGRKVGLQPGADLVPEGFLLGRVSEIHG